MSRIEYRDIMSRVEDMGKMSRIEYSDIMSRKNTGI